MNNTIKPAPLCKSSVNGLQPSTPSMETLCSDAIERIARLLGVTIDLDDPEPALVAAVERAIQCLVDTR